LSPSTICLISVVFKAGALENTLVAGVALENKPPSFAA
jgi:hypothetical protein